MEYTAMANTDNENSGLWSAEVLRTPEECFANLPDYDFAPNYLEVTSEHGGPMRMHYVDEGPKDGPAVLMLHGNPEWSFSYRHLIKAFVAAGYRAIAPDMLGFGKSDKPAVRYLHTIDQHIDWLLQFVEQLKLTQVSLVVQDWGGTIGLAMVAAKPELFDRVVASNTLLTTSEPAFKDWLPPSYRVYKLDDDTVAVGHAMAGWLAHSQRIPFFSAGDATKGVCTQVTDDIAAAYDAPFPEEKYNVAPRQFAMQIAINYDDPGNVRNRKVWEFLKTFDKPFITAYGDSDESTGGWDTVFQNLVPGAKGQPHVRYDNAGHFLGEDRPGEFSQLCLDFFAATR